MRSHYNLFLIILLFSGCDLFEYSAHQITPGAEEKDVNLKNILRILEKSPSDTIRIAFMSDSQRFYDETEQFVEYINSVSEQYDFVIHGGDISDFGLAEEFLWINDIMSDLHIPYLTVIGNHDVPVFGHEAYLKIFGPVNYSFTWGGYKFMFVNTNSLEYGYNGMVPDLEWIGKQFMERKRTKTILISHMGPDNSEFDPKLAPDFKSVLAREGDNLLFTLHGHNHSFSNGYYKNTKIPYWVTTSMDKKAFTKVELWDGGYNFEIITF
ncbi:metallophosphoesterase family protein [Marinigracilibium pacificum]|uniref:Metallophosphoesterase n=1 Tax=Marinigracilibium pacificum TaxID=2729599 RepID=A0A848J085_9BACT|nr:metallophosphoesterase [Marinigracilibium pacificum]NMM47960.1 metallophosphoesterase [Marinigracilibium pacificum]